MMRVALEAAAVAAAVIDEIEPGLLRAVRLRVIERARDDGSCGASTDTSPSTWPSRIAYDSVRAPCSCVKSRRAVVSSTVKATVALCALTSKA